MATEARIAPERLEIQDDPSEADLRFVEDHVDEFNMAATGFRDIRSRSSGASLTAVGPVLA
jgi:hypothetical protein